MSPVSNHPRISVCRLFFNLACLQFCSPLRSPLEGIASWRMQHLHHHPQDKVLKNTCKTESESNSELSNTSNTSCDAVCTSTYEAFYYHWTPGIFCQNAPICCHWKNKIQGLRSKKPEIFVSFALAIIRRRHQRVQNSEWSTSDDWAQKVKFYKIPAVPFLLDLFDKKNRKTIPRFKINKNHGTIPPSECLVLLLKKKLATQETWLSQRVGWLAWTNSHCQVVEPNVPWSHWSPCPKLLWNCWLARWINPSHLDPNLRLIGCLSHYLQGFSTIETVVGLGISEPSTVLDKNIQTVACLPPQKVLIVTPLSLEENMTPPFNYWPPQ